MFMFVLKGENMRFRLPMVLEITRCGDIENNFFVLSVYMHGRQLECTYLCWLLG